MAMAESSLLLDQLAATSRQSFSDEATRYKTLEEAWKLVRRLETPTDAISRMTFHDPAISMSLKVCSDLKIFRELESGPKSTCQLAEASKSDPILLRRFLRPLGAAAYVEECDVDVWSSTELTAAMACGFDCANDFLFDICMPAFNAVPSYLKGISWNDPKDKENGAWQKGHNTKLPFFDWLAANPASNTAFNNSMRMLQERRILWFETYPVRERLLSRFDPSMSDVLLVDVGGGIGFDLQDFHKAFPDHKGTLILQDQVSVVSNAEVDPSIKTLGHSFFDPQPIKGAAAYFLGSILHDWPDDDCRRILAHLRDAMKPGYSRILLREHVSPPKGASLLNASMDLVMLSLLSAKERTREDWDGLAMAVGLKVTDSWQDPSGLKHIIEIVLEGDAV